MAAMKICKISGLSPKTAQYLTPGTFLYILNLK